MPISVFIDTEFTDFRDPVLLSLGAVTEDGRELYVELDLSTPEGAAAQRAMSNFVHDTVVPQFRLHPQAHPTQESMGHALANWLLGLSARITLVYDFKTDLHLLVHSLKLAKRWAELTPQLEMPVFYRGMTDCAESAMEASLRQSEEQALFRHHALADARAMRSAYLVDKAAASPTPAAPRPR